MGYTALTSQALSAPPYLVSFLAVLATAYLSDRHRSRSPFVLFHALLATCGYTLIAIAGSLHLSPAWRYIGIFPAATGFFAAITIIITWTINNQRSDSARGTGVAMLNYVGQLGPMVGVGLFPDDDGPYYVKGMAVCAAFMGAVGILAWWLRIILQRENRKLGLGNGDEDEDGTRREMEVLVGGVGDVKKLEQYQFML